VDIIHKHKGYSVHNLNQRQKNYERHRYQQQQHLDYTSKDGQRQTKKTKENRKSVNVVQDVSVRQLAIVYHEEHTIKA
jgi:hypothetical protein